MILGVVLHVAKIYDVAHNWEIDDSRTSIFFEWLVRIIHLFRMPAFFIISGFFALYALEKYGPRRFLRLRLQRLLLPLLSTALLLNTVQIYLRLRYYLHVPTHWMLFFGHQLPQAWAHGDWIVHLWFLNNLMVYTLLATLFYDWCGGLDGWLVKGDRAWLAAWRRPELLLPVLALIEVGLRVPAYFLPFWVQRFGGVTSCSELAEYLPFFLFGMWLFHDQDLLRGFCRVRVWQCGLFAAAALILWASDAEGSLATKIIFNFTHGLLVWLSCFFCFALFRWLTDRPSALALYLADASYTIYLTHHLVVVALGLALLQVSISIYLKFTLVLVVTLPLTLAIHHFLILRFRLLRLMFNGKLPAKPAVVSWSAPVRPEPLEEETPAPELGRV